MIIAEHALPFWATITQLMWEILCGWKVAGGMGPEYFFLIAN